MADNIEPDAIMDGSKENPESPHSGGENLAAAEKKVADTNGELTAIETQTEKIHEQKESLSHESEESGSDLSGETIHTSPRITPPIPKSTVPVLVIKDSSLVLVPITARFP